MQINTRCKNDDNNQCVCPRCRCARELDFPPLGGPYTLPAKWADEFEKWEHRMDRLEANMRKRFPPEEK